MRTDVKICGLTNYDDAMVAIEAGADYLGFVLFEKSPRYVRPFDLVQLLDRLPDGVAPVAVCVNLPREVLDSLLADTRVSRVQLHGDEAPADFDGLVVPAWRAVSLEQGALKPSPEAWPDVERYVIDAAAPGRYGGTGETTDWNVAAQEALVRPLMLAGGLTPLNVADAIRQVCPVGVDTSSGVEHEPGRKDWDAVRTFVQEARDALAGEMEQEL